jgi:low affinity Fe/Cu permease
MPRRSSKQGGSARSRSRRRSSGDGDSADKPRPPNTVGDRFHAVADAITRAVGTPWAMLAALLVVVVWAFTGPIFNFSDTWQLVINTGTTIVTFLMVFAIQTAQNREATALHLKIDELISAHPQARNRLMAEELASEDEIEEDERAMLERSGHEGERRKHRAEGKREEGKRSGRRSSSRERSEARASR